MSFFEVVTLVALPGNAANDFPLALFELLKDAPKVNFVAAFA